MVLSGWQHISQTQVVLVEESELEQESELLLLLLSALVEESELLLEQYATLCEHLRLVLREVQSCSCLGTADAATTCEDLRLVLRESLLSCPAAAETATVDGSE